MGKTSSKDLTEWRAYVREEPFPEDRLIWQIAHLASVVVNIFGRKQGARAHKPEEFIGKFGSPDLLDPESFMDQIKAMNASMGGKEAGKNG